MEPEAADLELVAVAQRRPLDPAAVDEEAVEAAVVEGSKIAVVAEHDERVAAGDGGVLEPDIGRAERPMRVQPGSSRTTA